ncbi:MAG: flagellar biosynthesis regulator FlaF [Alphaproteobacteria bacterium]|nr:flagellar biosynthesis regulator FlaF [Alphaproteobacteria bacterium]MCD8566632.1 flagellar biosynthesis regulator FlaF [Alphaproteobacteria bacterium]
MQPNKPTSNNPYAQAAGAYGDHAQKHTPSQRELEARVLLKSAKLLQDLRNDWANTSYETIEETLKYNRQIWMMFYDTATDMDSGDERPNDLRSNIINLANFIFKREMEILADKDRANSPQKLDVLININREIAAGLLSSPQKTAE